MGIPGLRPRALPKLFERPDARLGFQQAKPVLRDDQPCRLPGRRQGLQQTHGVRRARCTSDRDDQRLLRHYRIPTMATSATPERMSRSANTNTKKAMEMTPFMVKNAASSRLRSSGFTSECSYSSSAAETSTPIAYSQPAPVAHPTAASDATVIACNTWLIRTARSAPNAAGIECRPCSRSNAWSCSAYRMSKPATHAATPAASTRSIQAG